MNELIEPKLNSGAKALKETLIEALKISPIVRLDISEFAEYEDISIRTAQRYAKSIESCDEFDMFRRQQSCRFFVNSGDDWRNHVGKNTPKFIAANSNTNGDLSFVSFVSRLSYIYILLKDKDLKKGDDTNDNGDIRDDTASGRIWFEETDGAFQELTSAVCHVCKLSPLLLLEEDEKKLLQLFKAGVEGPLVLAFYSFERRPNYWSSHWKGKRHGRPTIVDIMQTWELARTYVLMPYHSWPPVTQIQKTIAEIMVKHGRKHQNNALEEMAEFGYDEIVNRCPGGYYHLTMLSIDKMNIEIARAARSLREEYDEQEKEKQLA